MKVLSVVIPCYNSENYMRHCIETLLAGGEDVELLVVDDGSSDCTGAIADEYETRYPHIVRAVHQPNKGHGGAVNTGISLARGVYFKVVDSDDWVDADAYQKILDTLRGFLNDAMPVDLLVSNFVYEKQGAAHKRVMRYTGVLPENRPLSWEQAGHFHKGQYLLMHSVIYRTRLLRECGLQLPEHTFYVDNLYVYVPLAKVQMLYYLDVDFYRYFIGRDDQSVNEKVMIGRIDQQIRVNKLMLDSIRLDKISNKHQRQYMFNYLEIITTISSVLLIRARTTECLEKKNELWEYIRTKNPGVYRKLRWGAMGQVMNLPGKGGRHLSETAYRISQKLFGFN